MKKPWFVYILQSKACNKLYTGITTDITRRVEQHNTGKGAKFTRGGAPWTLVYYRAKSSHSEALVEEAAIKKLSRAQKEKLLTLLLVPSSNALSAPVQGQSRRISRHSC